MLHSFIAFSFILARVTFIAVGETVRHIGNLWLLLIASQPGITLSQAAPIPSASRKPGLPVIISYNTPVLAPKSPRIYRSPLARDPLTGSLV